jgi:hypothetical protein
MKRARNLQQKKPLRPEHKKEASGRLVKKKTAAYLLNDHSSIDSISLLFLYFKMICHEKGS